MTYPEDVLKAAREAVARYWGAEGLPEIAEEYRMGLSDNRPSVQAACRAIMAERQRCAGIAQAHLDRLPNYSASGENGLQDKVEEGYGNAALNIKAAILSQQETGDGRQKVEE